MTRTPTPNPFLFFFIKNENQKCMFSKFNESHPHHGNLLGVSFGAKRKSFFFVVVANFIYKLEIVIAQTSIIVLQINCSAVFISFVNDIHGSFLKKEKQNFSKEIHFAICVRMSVNRSFLLFIPLSLSLSHPFRNWYKNILQR